MAENGTVALTRDQILKLLPHGSIAMLVQGAIVTVEDDGGKISVTARMATWPMREAGIEEAHFPTKPVVRGTDILEALFQAAAMCFHEELGERLAYPGSVDNLRWRRKCHPDERIDLCAEVTRRRGDVFRFKIEALVGDEVACSGEFTGVLDKKPPVEAPAQTEPAAPPSVHISAGVPGLAAPSIG